MTETQKHVCRKLLSGNYFLRKTINHKGTTVYKLLDNKVNPIQNFRTDTVDAIFNQATGKIFKYDHLGRITFNLSVVRQQHGKSWLNKQYKSNLQNKKNAQKGNAIQKV